MTAEDCATDILVIGGGMAGLSAAVAAVQTGVRVTVVEKSAQLGGSARLSAGMFWAPKDISIARKTIPDADPVLQAKYLSEYLAAVQWMRDQGIHVDEQFNGIMTIGIGFPVNMPQWLTACEKLLAGGPVPATVLLNTSSVKLLMSNTFGVSGAVLTTKAGECFTVKAAATIIATGGFQGCPELVSKHLGPGCDSIFVRSNPYSTGDGYKLIKQAGAGFSSGLSTFYGHLLPSPLARRDVDPTQFIHLAQFQSGWAVLVNEHGKRFCDETFGDEVNNQHLARQPNRRGYMILNEATRVRYALSEVFPNAGKVDRLQMAKSVGGSVMTAETYAELVDKMASEWGLPKSQLTKTLDDFNVASSRAPGHEAILLDAPVGLNHAPHASLASAGPLWALAVQPSITFTYGGAKIDTSARVLTQDGVPVQGLYAAGMDAGGFSNYRYGGGLSLAFVTGRWAAHGAVGDVLAERTAKSRI
ncbi:uncharacterized protein V1518DRAFT_171846 [Limtongia smithiae]|uniref:uncharacterized protein n=1 Tax=Limtongia smithiae TaxID=1125753 RepID=UPI0034CEE09D